MANDSHIDEQDWQEHIVRAGMHHQCLDEEPEPDKHRRHVEPWLSALFQAEHLNLLVGSGLTTAVAAVAGAPKTDMTPTSFQCAYADAVEKAAAASATRLDRKDFNIEDQIRAVRELISGLHIIAEVSEEDKESDSFLERPAELTESWKQALDNALCSFLKKILDTERGIDNVLSNEGNPKSESVRHLLGGFLLPFASRSATRERLHIVTTNYDRLIEYGCDLLGLRMVDRFVGNLAPVFHSSRLGIDLHYNPPGIRGEPRYLEGVVRLSKLHGSVDWRYVNGPSGQSEVQRCSLPFGAPADDPAIPDHSAETLLIYPNPAKDVETLEYPYAELFRDFAAAVCQPNAVVVTYGYGFGDDHVNRVLGDMLSIPSTHLVIISYDDAGGRLRNFYNRLGRQAQITLLIGSHFGDLGTLVRHYLPKPAIDRTTWRMVELLGRRGALGKQQQEFIDDVPKGQDSQ